MKTFINVGYDLRAKFFRPETIARLESLGEVTMCPGHPLKDDELKAQLTGVDLLLTGWGQRLVKLEHLGDVKVVAHTGGTVGGIIDEGVFEADIPVLSGNQYYAESVAEGVIAYMLFALRNMGYYSSELKAGRWQPTDTKGLLDRSVGIVSLGAISKLVIKHLRSFRCTVKVYSTRRDPALAEELGFTYATLDEIFETCDIVSIHTARTPQTYHMIGAQHFAKMKEGSLFLNTARGEVVDEAALLEALKTGRFHAVLDVYDQEPLPADHPLISSPNVTLFPHQCGPTYDRLDYIVNRLIDDTLSYLAGGEMKNRIPLEVARRMTH